MASFFSDEEEDFLPLQEIDGLELLTADDRTAARSGGGCLAVKTTRGTRRPPGRPPSRLRRRRHPQGPVKLKVWESGAPRSPEAS
jgi:hypothetical protein